MPTIIKIINNAEVVIHKSSKDKFYRRYYEINGAGRLIGNDYIQNESFATSVSFISFTEYALYYKFLGLKE